MADEKKGRRAQRVGLATIACVVLLAPVAVGALDGPAWFIGSYALLCAVVAGSVALTKRGSRTAMRLRLAILSSCVALTAVDLAARVLVADAIYYRPHERFFVNPWPVAPSLMRYARNVSYEGQASGDLAALSGVAEYREPRRVAFRTDRFGFRNDATPPGEPLELIVLGDSFGAGNGTSQERTWVSLLRDRHGVRLYNLSLPGGPWQELMNLKWELPRLDRRSGSLVIWMLFTGNDLHDDIYHETLRRPEPTGVVERTRIGISNFRRRSLVRELWRRATRHDQAPASGSVIAREVDGHRPILFWGPHVERRNQDVRAVVRHPNFRTLARVFGEMREMAAAAGLRVVVVAAPSKAEVYSWVLDGTSPPRAEARSSGISQALGRLSRDNAFAFLDLKPLLVGEATRRFEERGQLLWWYDDTHWNEIGHELVASIVHRQIVMPALDPVRNSPGELSNSP